MAKATPKPTATPNSKIRFILLEAELNDGDLSQITSAISNALGKNSFVNQRTFTAINGISNNTDPASDNAEHGSTPPENFSDGSNETQDIYPSKPAKQKKFPTPKVLSDVDLNGGDMPFSKFAEEKSPSTDVSRHLLVAYWFKTYRDTSLVSANHAYTCYKKVGWGTDIKNFSKPFQNLATSGKGEMKDGLFAINHLGEDAIEKIGKGKA